MKSHRYSCHILMKREFSRQIFENFSNINFNGDLSIGSRAVPCGRADLKKLMSFRNVAKVPKHSTRYSQSLRHVLTQVAYKTSMFST